MALKFVATCYELHFVQIVDYNAINSSIFYIAEYNKILL